MNKVQVGHAPSPNLKAVRSKIGSLDNATYKPGGGNVKIESKKIDIKAGPRIEAKNDKYMPKGGEKKVSPMASFSSLGLGPLSYHLLWNLHAVVLLLLLLLCRRCCLLFGSVL